MVRIEGDGGGLAACIVDQHYAFTEEDGAGLPESTLNRSHLLFQEIFIDFPPQNNRLYLDGGLYMTLCGIVVDSGLMLSYKADIPCPKDQ